MSFEGWFVIFVFAVYRLSELITSDLIFDKIRRWVAKRAAAGGKFWKAMAAWIHCPLCVGVWISFPAAFLYSSLILNFINILYITPLWFGMAGMQYFLSLRGISTEVN